MPTGIRIEPLARKAGLGDGRPRTAASTPPRAHRNPDYGTLRHQRLLLAISAVISATLWVYACGDGATEPTPLPPDPPRPTTVTVSPATVQLTALGAMSQLSTEVRDQNGQVIAGASVTWASNAATVATVSVSGLVTAVANGSATITATAGAASGSATVTVAQEVSAVAVTPAETTIAALGDTLQLAAQALDANGNAVEGAEFAWESSDATVATVDASGLVMAMADGSATITATAGSASGSATVTVAQEVSTVAVTPAEANIAALGDTLRLSAEALDANGNAVAGAEFSWESSDDAVATVNATGLVTALGSGSATITAKTGSVSGNVNVSVAQEVRAVVVAPDTATVLVGDTLRLVATATDANGQAVTGIAFAWASGDTTVAVVDASGLVTGVGAGQVQVTAAAAGTTGRAQLAVVAPVPTTVAVTPDTVVLTAVGQTAQLNAEVRDQAGRPMDGVPVAWWSADTTVAVVDSAGLVSAVGGGVATITARAGEASGDALVTVMQSVDAVTVSPPADTIAPGDTLRLVAAAYDENGHVLEGASFTWSSSNIAVATVDPSGLVRGTGEGTATVTAAAGDAAGTSGITVTNPDRAALVALYNATDGPNWVDNTNWLTDAPLGEWYGVTADALGRVVQIVLGGRWDVETQRDTSHGLRGELPPELGRLSNLEILALSRNDLSGELPPDLGNLAELWMLRLASNKLTGPIPPELANLAKLRFLDLSQNDLTGQIPPELGGLAELFSLILEGNALLTGPIPPELGNLANLDRLLLGWSNLGGSIPPELGNLSKLKTLSLYDAKLTGPIPPELGNLSELTYLELGVNGLTGAIPSELGHLSALTTLSLPSNNVTGAIPSELGHLLALKWLNLSNNNLTGSVPRSFLQLYQLRSFFVGGQDVCVPGISALALWFEGIESRDTDRIFCNAAEVAALESLYRGTGGADWAASGGWLANHGVEEWYGVTADSLGHVTELDLEGNGLTGQLPAALGDMPQMTVLQIADNELSGRIPRSLTALPLVEFRYAQTELCAPRDASFQSWLNAIASLEGTGVKCDPPSSDREILEILYNETGGPDWTNNANWLTDAPLGNWYGVDVDGEGRVSGLRLVINDFVGNNLTGRIPPELGNLVALEHLSLNSNDLTGSIPLELGNLVDLRELHLWFNDLTGSIPPELGNLTELTRLGLSDNNLTGPIPPELGNLVALNLLGLSDNNLTGPIPPELGNLVALNLLGLSDNNLTGPIPPELGNLPGLTNLDLDSNNLTGPIPPELGNPAYLWWLSLGSNNLSGPIPAELGALAGLVGLELGNNGGLVGALPPTLTGLGRLRELHAGGTGLCAPTDAAFQAWLAGVQRLRIARCTAGEAPAAYLTQAVQSREFPVPLVAGERALLRVFPTAGQATSEGVPLVRARFYLGGQERHVLDVPGKSDPIPTEVDEGSLSRSANAQIPAWVIQPGLEMVIEVDPDGTLDPGLGVARRIPETGRLTVDVKAMPLFDLTLIPFIWTATHDSSIVELVSAMAADPEQHELFEETRTLMPIGDLAVTAHEPVLVSSNRPFALLSQTDVIRVMEGGTGHYMGMSFPPPGASVVGLADLGGWSSYAAPQSGTIAHELGHNLSLEHAPCRARGRGSIDPLYPYSDGTTGAWGYDLRKGRLVSPLWGDLMAFCPPSWISDYHFSNALRYRLVNEGTAAAAVSASTRSLLLWGGVSADSVPYLEPAFVIDAAAAVPDSAGEYRITGRTASGGELFSLSFTMSATADGDGSSSFAFAVPVRPGWDESLATITLDGLRGSATLDGDSDIPMTILRDPRTGQVRGILRDPPPAIRAAADAIGTSAPGAPGLEVLFSRGIPGAVAWRR